MAYNLELIYMRPFKIALGILTFLKLDKETPNRDEMSRSLAYFPVIGILVGVVLVCLDQILGRTVPVWISNALLLLILIAIRYSRGLEEFLRTFNILETIGLSVLKYFFLLGIPSPLRWISFTFMTTFSSGAVALALKRKDPKDWEWEDVLWASFTCVFLSFICGSLGIFVLGMCAGGLAIFFRFFSQHVKWVEEGLELIVLLAVMGFYEIWRVL